MREGRPWRARAGIPGDPAGPGWCGMGAGQDLVGGVGPRAPRQAPPARPASRPSPPASRPRGGRRAQTLRRDWRLAVRRSPITLSINSCGGPSLSCPRPGPAGRNKGGRAARGRPVGSAHGDGQTVSLDAQTMRGTERVSSESRRRVSMDRRRRIVDTPAVPAGNSSFSSSVSCIAHDAYRPSIRRRRVALHAHGPHQHSTATSLQAAPPSQTRRERAGSAPRRAAELASPAMRGCLRAQHHGNEDLAPTALGCRGAGQTSGSWRPPADKVRCL